MTTANARKGSETERMVAKYLREQGFWMADRRLREGRQDDMGDIDGVPYTTIQVKYVASNRLQAWVTDTLKQRDTAGTPLCLLVVRTKYRNIEGWDAYAPTTGYPEAEAWTWTRMDLRLAVAVLKTRVAVEELGQSFRSAPSSPTTSTDSSTSPHVNEEMPSAPSTESDESPSPTT